jgi:hypothetical protein
VQEVRDDLGVLQSGTLSDSFVASISVFSQELKVRMKTGVRKGGNPSLTSGGAALNSHSSTSPSLPRK